MLRYVSAIASVLFLAFAFFAPTAGLLGFAILMAVVSATVAVFGFAAARIDDRSRDQVYVPTPEESALLRERAQRQREAFAQKGAAAPRREPPAGAG